MLHQPIESVTTRSASQESEAKRVKLSTPESPLTVASLVSASAYSSLETFEQDVESAVAAALAPFETEGVSAAPLSQEQMKAQANILALQKMARTLIAREGSRLGQKSAASQPVDSFVKEEEEEFPEGRTVLTLYGSAQGPKQLFSSLQQPVAVRPDSASASGPNAAVKVTLPLRESQLPNIISTTEVFPVPSDKDQKEKAATFGELFPPPPHLQALAPPKFPKSQATKGNTVTWTKQDAGFPIRNKSSQIYSNQPQAAGHWLGYGGVDMPKDDTSPTAKQKSRQRALSTGEAQLPLSEATRAAVQQAKDEALFRSVYSSFAPSRDDSMAVVPTEVKNMVWWHKSGEERFKNTFPVDPALVDPELLALGGSAEQQDDPLENEAAFNKMLEDFVPMEDDDLPFKAKSEAEKQTDEILQEISELIATLASHQRIRNSSLATNPLTPAAQNSSLATLAGDPFTPSAEEVDVYQMLKHQLAIMIAQLPPYAVAKLNGDQLDELNISRTLIIETDDHKGVLEDDQVTRRAAIPPASTPSLPRMASTGSSHFAQSTTQYSRTTPSVHAPAPRPVQSNPTFFSQPQVPRTPAVNYAQRPSGAATYQTPATTYTTSSRPSYNASQYPQQAPRPSFPQPPTNQFYPQRPAAPASNFGGGVSNSQFFHQTPQQQANRYSGQPTTNGYYQQQQRPNPAPASGTYSFNANATPAARTVSPMKPGAAAPPGPQSNMRGGSSVNYSTPGQAPQVRNSYYAQGGPGVAPPQFGSAQPSTPGVPSGSYNPMGAGVGQGAQQMMLDRQNAQVAAQSQARLAAQSGFPRHGSGTPQPPVAQPGTPSPALPTQYSPANVPVQTAAPPAQGTANSTSTAA